jgi:putative ABC transport system permease protein
VDKKTLLDEIRKQLGREGLTVADVRQLKHEIESTFGRVIAFASAVAGMSMLVASVGVGNAIVAAVRTRQWRLGVLRAIGLTRGELLRMLLAEAVLLSLVGMVLGVAFGIILAVNANQLYAGTIGFDPPLVLPWDVIGWACLFVVFTGLLATLAPAISTATRQPLALLQAGRSAS